MRRKRPQPFTGIKIPTPLATAVREIAQATHRSLMGFTAHVFEKIIRDYEKFREEDGNGEYEISFSRD